MSNSFPLVSLHLIWVLFSCGTLNCTPCVIRSWVTKSSERAPAKSIVNCLSLGALICASTLAAVKRAWRTFDTKMRRSGGIGACRFTWITARPLKGVPGAVAEEDVESPPPQPAMSAETSRMLAVKTAARNAGRSFGTVASTRLFVGALIGCCIRDPAIQASWQAGAGQSSWFIVTSLGTEIFAAFMTPFGHANSYYVNPQ